MVCHDSAKLCTFPTFTWPRVVGDSMATVDARRTAKASETAPKQRSRVASVGPYQCGLGQKLLLIAGPCVIESEAHALRMAARLAKIAAAAKVPLIFKASYDKANRSSLHSYRGPGLRAGLAVLREIKERFGMPVLTDIHEPSQAAAAAEVCDVLQVPAMLSRQTPPRSCLPCLNVSSVPERSSSHPL